MPSGCNMVDIHTLVPFAKNPKNHTDKDVNLNGEQIPFNEIITIARQYIDKIGGFEKLAEWGLQ